MWLEIFSTNHEHVLTTQHVCQVCLLVQKEIIQAALSQITSDIKQSEMCTATETTKRINKYKQPL